MNTPLNGNSRVYWGLKRKNPLWEGYGYFWNYTMLIASDQNSNFPSGFFTWRVTILIRTVSLFDISLQTCYEYLAVPGRLIADPVTLNSFFNSPDSKSNNRPVSVPAMTLSSDSQV